MYVLCLTLWCPLRIVVLNSIDGLSSHNGVVRVDTLRPFIKSSYTSAANWTVTRHSTYAHIYRGQREDSDTYSPSRRQQPPIMIGTLAVCSRACACRGYLFETSLQ